MGILSDIATTCIWVSDCRRERTTASRCQSVFAHCTPSFAASSTDIHLTSLILGRLISSYNNDMTQLRAWLKPNHLTADTSDYTVVPDTLGGVGMEQIIADMQFQGVELQKETIIDIVNRFNRLAAQRVTEGYTVNTGLVNMRPMIAGVFHGTAVDPEKHRVYTHHSGHRPSQGRIRHADRYSRCDVRHHRYSLRHRRLHRQARWIAH